MLEQDSHDEEYELQVQCDPPKFLIPLKDPICPGPDPHQVDLDINPEPTKPGDEEVQYGNEALGKGVNRDGQGRGSDPNYRVDTPEDETAPNTASAEVGLTLNSGLEDSEGGRNVPSSSGSHDPVKGMKPEDPKTDTELSNLATVEKKQDGDEASGNVVKRVGQGRGSDRSHRDDTSEDKTTSNTTSANVGLIPNSGLEGSEDGRNVPSSSGSHDPVQEIKPEDPKTNTEVTNPAVEKKQDVDGALNMADERDGQGGASGRNHRGLNSEDMTTLTPASASAHALNLNSGVDGVGDSKDRRSDQGSSAKRSMRRRGSAIKHTLSEKHILLWTKALKSEDRAELLRLVTSDEMLPRAFIKTEVLRYQWDSESRGRQTALYIAAKSDDAELAKVILDKFLEYRGDDYESVLLPIGRNVFDIVGNYIRAVDKKSRKTAFELAKENNRSESSKVICEKIIDTLNRNEAKCKIVQAVSLRNMLQRRCIGETLGEMMETLSEIISIRDCTLLIRCLDKIQDAEDNKSSAYWKKYLWKFEDDTGRTMLHVAAMQGCFLLAKQLLDIARERNNRDYIVAIDPVSGLTAFKMANDVIGNRSIAQYIIKTLGLLKDESYVHPTFSKVYPRTFWCRVLGGAADDEQQMMFKDTFLYLSYELLLQTYNGNTILHVAIILSDLNLVEHILQIFGEEKKISFGDAYFPSELTWKELFEQTATVHEHMFNEKYSERHEFVPTFEAIMKDRGIFIGSTMQLIDHFIRLTENDVSENAVYIGIREMLKDYDKEKWFTDSNHLYVENLEDLDENSEDSDKHSEVLDTLKTYISENWKKELWDDGYCADVDFNFELEPRHTLLKVHYAFKHPLIFKEFLEYLFKSFFGFRTCYPYLQDAQGRTVFHILIDQNSDTEVRLRGPWILKEVLEVLGWGYKLDAQDGRGRSLNDILLMKNYLQNNIFLQNNSVLQYFDFMEWNDGIPRNGGSPFDVRDSLDYHDYMMLFMLYHVATFLKQTSVAQHIWSRIPKKDSKRLRKMLRVFKSLPFIASSTGNQVLLLLLMEEDSVDLTIHDASGRTLLHHAADPTLLEFSALLECPMIEHCFSTVMDLCEVQKKWNVERKKTAMILPSRESEKQSDVEKLVTSMNVERKACILLLLQAGVDLSQEDKFKKTPNIGPNVDDTTFRSWWYDMVVKDSTDKKNSFNQAASALSVVATLVAATSYIGPLQPPMNYTDGLVNTSVKLVRMFMVTNTLAFYLAMTSVILAVVPSLPMSRESVLSELKRAQHIVTVSLYLLLMSIVCIILSFGASSVVVMQDQYSFPGSDLLFFPTFFGCLLCFFAIVSFLIRVMKLTFYNSPTIRSIYQFSFTKFCKDVIQWCARRIAACHKIVRWIIVISHLLGRP